MHTSAPGCWLKCLFHTALYLTIAWLWVSAVDSEVLLAENNQAVMWPLFPDSSAHELSALYSDFIEAPEFMHSGIDITVAIGTPVYAVESGYVKTVTTLYGNVWSWRVVISDSPGTDSCAGWMYAHIAPETMPSFSFDQWMEAGDYLGDVVDIPMSNVDHLHLSRVKYYGDFQHWADNFDDWQYVENPLDLLPADNDTVMPVLENAIGNQLLAFSSNEAVDYFEEGASIAGEVDIICLAYDYHNWYGWKMIPYSLEYRIEGDSSIPWTMAACFTGPLGRYSEMFAYTTTFTRMTGYAILTLPRKRNRLITLI